MPLSSLLRTAKIGKIVGTVQSADLVERVCIAVRSLKTPLTLDAGLVLERDDASNTRRA